MAAHHHTAELHAALESNVPYAALSYTLQQRMTAHEYQQQAVLYSVMRYRSYDQLPHFVLEDVTEEKYYKSMVRCLQAKLQLYPHSHVLAVVHYTTQTPLSYYTTMIAELLKKEHSYDTLPNFTAVDILNCIGIGRNEYLELTREVRSEARWNTNKSYVKEHLPTELLASVELSPFWRVFPVCISHESLKKYSLSKEELELYTKLLHHRVGKGITRAEDHGEAAGKKGCSSLTKEEGTHRRESSPVSGDTDANNHKSIAGSPATPAAEYLAPPAQKVPPRTAATPAGEAGPIGPVTTSAPLDGVSDTINTSKQHLFYACQLPKIALSNLHRKGLVCAALDVSIEDQVVVPPLERFVMNRTSDDPVEVLLYKVLGTIDNRTSLSQLAQLLTLDEKDLCFAILMCIRLGLAHRRTVDVPPELNPIESHMHTTWNDSVQNLLSDGCGVRSSAVVDTDATISATPRHVDCAKVASAKDGSPQRVSNDGNIVEGSATFHLSGGKDNNDDVNHPSSVRNVSKGDGAPAKRLVLLYDTSLLGSLMMTNVSADPSFKQHVVTLFEVGKLSEELMGSFIEKLEEVQDSKEKCTLFGEAAQYIQDVISLREVLKALRKVVGPDGERGVDMIKVESMNEQDPTTRYSLLGRNYWAYFVTSPVLQAPMIDVNISGVYGSTVGLMPSPWMMMFLYSKTRRGPPSLLLPVGTPILAWPEIFQEGKKRCVTKLRLQLLMVNTEVTYVDAATSIILANEMITTAPLFVQRISDVPLEIPAVSAMVAAAAETVCENEGSEFDGAEAMKEIVTESPFHMSLTLTVPFTASDDDAIGLLRASILQQRQSATTVRFVGSQPLHTHNPTHHANNGDTALGESCELELSRSNLLDAAIDVPIAAGVVATEEAPPARYLECFHEAVAALQLQNSLGCFTFHISLYEVAVVPTNSGGVHFYRVDAASIVDMGLGFNLADQRCCDLMVQQLQDLLDEPRMEAHCTAMLRLSRELGEFLQCHSSLTTVEHEQMSLQSAAIAGPIAQQHVRRLGEKGNSGAPFPSEVLMFDGERLSAFEDWDPLVELWQA